MHEKVPKQTHLYRPSNLEDTITMSAGRCWPLVTFTMSPTATLWTGCSSATACQRKTGRGGKGKKEGALGKRMRGNRRDEEEMRGRLISDKPQAQPIKRQEGFR